MKVVILAGGLGTRLAEETDLRPKPMVEIGGKPILWHIMKIFSAQGFNEFIICCGYRGYMIKEYFANYYVHESDVTFDLANNDVVVHRGKAEKWKVTLVDTGLNTNTGGRLMSVLPYLEKDQPFFFTYGDGVSDVPLDEVLKSHFSSGKKATVTAVTAPHRFGMLKVDPISNEVSGFQEKPLLRTERINGGFFVLEPSVVDYVHDPTESFENKVIPQLVKEGELGAYNHDGFWQPMDTLRDKITLQNMWDANAAPWKIW